MNVLKPLDALFDGLDCSILDGRVTLEEVAPVGRMATAPLRGLSGWLVLERFPEIAAACFKPGQDGNQPPAYAFQLRSEPRDRLAGFDFRCVTWDPGHRLADALCEAWRGAQGRPFGQGKARVKTVTVERRRDGVLRTLRPEPLVEACEVALATPVLLKDGARGWLGPGTLTLPRLAGAVCRRLNALSACYGNGGQLDELALMAEAAGAGVARAELRWVSPERKSSVQGGVIKLSGVVGRFSLTSVPMRVAELLAAATLVHVGKHACEGCGRLAVQES